MEKHMSMDMNELSLDELAKVSGSLRVGGGPVICPKPPVVPRGPHSGASGSIGDGDTNLGHDYNGDSGGGGGGYKGDDNYLREF
jgi:hypothetical protein